MQMKKKETEVEWLLVVKEDIGNLTNGQTMDNAKLKVKQKEIKITYSTSNIKPD